MSQISIPYKLRILTSNEDLINELITTLCDEGLLRVAILTSKTPNALITNYLESSLFNKVTKVKTFQVVDASLAYVNQLPINDVDVVIGVGGGKVIDVAKYAAHMSGLPYISVPTMISNIGICSPISVLKEKYNKYSSFQASIPFAMFAPLHLIEKAEDEYLISGICDLLSCFSALDDWKLTSEVNKEEMNDYAYMLSKNAISQVLFLIENNILLRKSKDQLLKNNMESIVNSVALLGLAIDIAGSSRPCSGAEHLISYSIDELFSRRKMYGIQVAFGMYLATYLKYKHGFINKDFFEEIRTVFRYLGVPTSPSAMGFIKEDLIKIIQNAPKTRPDRYTYLNKMNLETESLNESLNDLFAKSKISVSV